MAVSQGGTMASHPHSWAEVEENLCMEIAIWKSAAAAPESRRPKEYRELVERAFVKLVDRGVATISIGTGKSLEWKLAPWGMYEGYCEQQDDWLLVPDSGFRLALCSPHECGELQVYPCSEDMASDTLGVDDKLNDILARFFSSEEMGTSAPPTLRRTLSQKKRAEIIGKKLGPPFVRCVNDLRSATSVSDVLDAILGFSAAYISNQQVLQQVAEEFDVEDSYFYDEELKEEDRLFLTRRRNGALWVRQQVRDAAMKCQVAAESTSEAAKLGARLLVDIYDTRGNPSQGRCLGTDITEYQDASHTFQRGNGEEKYNPLVVENPSNLEKNELNELNLNSSPGLELRVDDLESHGAANPSGSSLDNYLNASGDMEDDNKPFDAFSDTSWDLVQAQANDVEDEDDVLGAGILDAENLDMMLRDRDPCGSTDCSNLIKEYLSLNSMNSASSTEQEETVDGQETPRSSVLKRLASFSSSHSGWPDFDIQCSSSALAPSNEIQKVQLETLAEEPACDSATARLCLTFVRKAAAKGDVLQWCSCKFNKSRRSVELRFQVGAFMEDDIATLSTGIHRHGSPLHVEIFLDSTDMRHSLLQGSVRIAAYQGISTENTPPLVGSSHFIPHQVLHYLKRNIRQEESISGQYELPPVVGLSCYIPHLVRQYLKRRVHEQSRSGYELFPDGELLTGLMKHVVAKLAFLKDSCCVCDGEAFPDPIASFIPRPCEQNLCQALHEAWLVVAPPMVVERSTVEYWLKTCFKEGVLSDGERMLQYMDDDMAKQEWVRNSSYTLKLRLVMKWLRNHTVDGSWLKIVPHSAMKSDAELDYRARLLAIARNLEDEVSQEQFR